MVPFAYVIGIFSSFIDIVNGEVLKSILFPLSSVTFRIISTGDSSSASTLSPTTFMVEFILPASK